MVVPRAASASAGLRWPVFMAACWMPAAAPAVCSRTCGSSGRTCRRSAWNGPPRRAARAAAKSGVPVARGSVNALPFAEASFDAAVAADLLCHRAVDPAMALAELRRVLRPGGRLVVNMPAYAWLLSVHDRLVHNVRRCTARQLAAMLREAGFVRVRARYWNGLLLPLMVVQRKLLASRTQASDVASFPPWLDAMFHAMTEIERRLPFRLPAGGSVLATAERP